MSELRLALRALAKSRTYSAVAVLTLGLAIGATTAIFSVVHGVMLRPLPYREPERLVAIWEATASFPRVSVSYPDYLDWSARQTSFSNLGCYRNATMTLTGGERAERLRALNLSATLLPTLGVDVALGRNFRVDEDQLGAPAVAIVSHSLWQRVFAGDPTALGKSLMLDGKAYTVVGVLPRQFLMAPETDVVTPIGQLGGALRERGNHPGIGGVARLRDGVTLAAARAEMDGIGRAIAVETKREKDIILPALAPLHQDLTKNVGSTLWILLGAVAFVLLIAVANVASLAMARGAARRREMAVRAALGASRGRLLRLVLVESIVVAIAGGALGVLLAMWGVDLLGGMRPGSIPTESVISVDWRVLAFSLAVSVGAGLLLGILPALGAARAVDLSGSLKDGEHGSGGVSRTRARNVLVVAEVALALMLLVGAGAALRGFVTLSRLDLGFRAGGLMTAYMQIPAARADDRAAYRAFIDRLGERVRRIPGVAAATVSTGLPIAGTSEASFSVEGEAPPDQEQMSVYYSVDDHMAETLGLTLLAGRFIEAGDTGGTLPVAVVDEHAARTVLRGEALGKHIRLDGAVFQVVGVVRHVNAYGPGEVEVAPHQIYLAIRQTPPEWKYPNVRFLGVTVHAADGVKPGALVHDLEAAVAELDPNLPVFGAQTMDQMLRDTLAARRFAMLLLAGFAVVALVLAVVGLYSVMSYLVAQRTREIGVRMALGARPGDVSRLVVGQGLKLTVLGLGLGVLGALALRHVLATLVAGVEAIDPLTVAGVGALLGAAALLASWLPARRAARTDPMIALRAE